MKYAFSSALIVLAFAVLTYGQVPQLISPAQEDILDNGCEDQSDYQTWEFSWTEVRGAKRYHLHVQGPKARIPVFNNAVEGTSHTIEARAYVAPQNAIGWTWRVRAHVNGRWGPWSRVRNFSVEPLNTDCP